MGDQKIILEVVNKECFINDKIELKLKFENIDLSDIVLEDIDISNKSFKSFNAFDIKEDYISMIIYAPEINDPYNLKIIYKEIESNEVEIVVNHPIPLRSVSLFSVDPDNDKPKDKFELDSKIKFIWVMNRKPTRKYEERVLKGFTPDFAPWPGEYPKPFKNAPYKYYVFYKAHKIGKNGLYVSCEGLDGILTENKASIEIIPKDDREVLRFEDLPRKAEGEKLTQEESTQLFNYMYSNKYKKV